MAEFVTLAKVDEIESGRGKAINVNGRSIALFNVDGSFFAIDGTCVHRGGPLGEGDLEGFVVTCPWHQWTYDVRTGNGVLNPAAKVACYETKVEAGKVLVSL
jgi:nitrite reductase (NADH) small subunit